MLVICTALASSNPSLGTSDGFQEIEEYDVVSAGSSFIGLDTDGAVYLDGEVDSVFSYHTEKEMFEDEDVILPVDSGVVVGPDAPDFALVSADPIRVVQDEVVTSGPLYRYHYNAIH